MTGKEIGARGLITALGDEFERRGWDDDDHLALAITRAASAARSLDATSAATLASSLYLARNNIDLATLQRAIAAVFAGMTLREPDYDETRAVADVHNSIQISGDRNVVSNVNLGGRVFSLSMGSPKEEVLAAVEALVGDALSSGLSADDLLAISQMIDGRQDLAGAELEQAVLGTIREVGPEPGRLAEFRDAVLTSAASGILVQAIIAAAGAAL
jgi:hypothetical protein